MIRTRATETPQKLADRLDMSLRSVFRLIEDLRSDGFPNQYDSDAHTYYYDRNVKFSILLEVGDEKLLNIRSV